MAICSSGLRGEEVVAAALHVVDVPQRRVEEFDDEIRVCERHQWIAVFTTLALNSESGIPSLAL
jgi:hypothetical protein